MIAEAGLAALWLAASLSLLQMVLGWAAVWGGHTLVTAEPACREQLDPVVWVCTPAQWSESQVAVPGILDRARGGGARLRRVYVVGTVPSSPRAPAGVEVGPWTL